MNGLQHSGARLTQIGDQVVWLMPQGALYWPAQSTLFVADVHLGKAASFRAQGQPVPAGTTAATLKKLSQALDCVQARRLIVLGDFLHSAAIHRSTTTLHAVRQWRERHASLLITLIRGNHDDHAGDPDPALQIDVVNEPYPVGPFACRHEPLIAVSQSEGRQSRSSESFWLAGHVHPVLVLKGATGPSRRERVRLKGFIVQPGGCILPAFGEFTGGHPYEPATRDRCFVVVEQTGANGSGDVSGDGSGGEGAGRVLEVPVSLVSARSRPFRQRVRNAQNAQDAEDAEDVQNIDAVHPQARRPDRNA